MDLTSLYTLSYKSILTLFIQDYINQYGEHKYQAILEKVNTSSKISKLISQVSYKRVPINTQEIILVINSISYFIFSRGQTQAVAALIAFQRWNSEVNSTQYLIDDEGLAIRAIAIIDELKTTFF